MKKLSIIFTVFFTVTFLFSSCSTEQETQKFKLIDTETATVFGSDISPEEIYSNGFYHTVKHGDNLNDLSINYLGDRTRWGELLIENDYLTKEADKRNYRVPTGPAYKIYPGEIVLLPNDAIGALSFGKSSSLVFNLGNLKWSDFKREIPVQKDMSKLYEKDESLTPTTKVVEEKDETLFVGLFPLLLGYLLPIILAILLIALLVAFLYWLFGNINQTSTTSTTVSSEYDENCGCDNTTTRLDKFPAIFKAAGEIAGERGYADIKIKDGDLETDIYISKQPDGYSDSEVDKFIEDELEKQECLHTIEVQEIMFELLTEQLTPKSIVLFMDDEDFPNFKTKKELKKFIRELKKQFKKTK